MIHFSLMVLFSSFYFYTNLSFAQEAQPVNSYAEVFKKEKEFNQAQRDFLNNLDNLKIERPETYQEISSNWKKITESLFELIDNPYHQKYSDDLLVGVWQNEITEKFSLLRETSFARGNAIRAARAQGRKIISLDNETVSLVLMEIKLIPYRMKAYAYSKMFSFQKNFSSGIEGIVNLIQEFITLLFVLFIPFLSVKLSRTLVKRLEEQRQKSFYLSFKSKVHRYLSFYLSFLIPLAPYLIALLAISAVTASLSGSNISELAELLVYIEYYVYYKIVRILIEYVLKYFAENIHIQNKEKIKEKIQSTSLILSSFFLVLYSLKHAFRSILGESIVFSVVEIVIFWVVLLLLGFLFSRWHIEIKGYLKTTGIKSLSLLAKLCSGRWRFLVCLPAAFVVLFHFLGVIIIRWGTQFDYIKSLYAKVLRISIESKDADTSRRVGAPQEYQDQFYSIAKDESKAWVPLNEKFLNQISELVTNWVEDEDGEKSIALYGSRGSGKTGCLKYIANQLEEKSCPALRISIPKRTYAVQKLERFLEENFPESDEKKVVLIDNAHNLFLSTINGFEAYRNFLEFMNNKRPNLFWIVAFNEQSWVYLNSVLGNNQYFRKQLRVPRWTDIGVQELILSIHKETGYKLKFDQVFSTNTSGGGSQTIATIEQRYFQLLWEQSRGIPGVAIELWIKSLQSSYKGQLTVCLPRDNKTSEFSKLQNSMFFVYSAIVKHDNLKLKEAVLATDLPEGLVRQALMRGLEEGFLTKHEGRYRVAMSWFTDMVNFLKGRNLVYEAN